MSKYLRSRHVPLVQEDPAAVTEEEVLFASNMEAAGAVLKAHRQQSGLSRGELGVMVGMDSEHIALLEEGKQEIPVVLAKRFGEIFHASHHIFL